MRRTKKITRVTLNIIISYEKIYIVENWSMGHDIFQQYKVFSRASTS